MFLGIWGFSLLRLSAAKVKERREFLEWENTYWQYLWENSDEPFNVEGIEFFKEDNIVGNVYQVIIH